MVHICWVFYFSKFIEMLDTVSSHFLLRVETCEKKRRNSCMFLYMFAHAENTKNILKIGIRVAQI